MWKQPGIMLSFEKQKRNLRNVLKRMKVLRKFFVRKSNGNVHITYIQHTCLPKIYIMPIKNFMKLLHNAGVGGLPV